MDSAGHEGSGGDGVLSGVVLGGSNLVKGDSDVHREGRSGGRGVRPRPHSLSGGLGSGRSRRGGEAASSRDIREFF